MDAKKVILTVVGLVVLIGGIVVGVLLVNQNQDIREKAAPATSVYISPATQSKNPGNTFTLTVGMDTAENQVTGVDIRLNYNSDAIEVTSLQKGSGITALDTKILDTFDNATGKISYAYFTVNKANAITGSSINILTISGKIKTTASSGTSPISFDPATVISGINEGVNVIVNKTAASIIIASTGGGSTPTGSGQAATTTPTGSGQKIATPTATATATGGVGGTAIKTATPTPTKTATATLTESGQTATDEPTSTAFPVPETGASWPTILGLGFGGILILGSLFLAF